MSEAEPQPVRPPATDPMKSFPGIAAGILGLEAIVVLLALLVVSRFTEGALTSVGVTLVAVLGVLMFLAAGVQRRPWGLGFALVLQAALLACGFVHLSLLFVGLLFVLVWGTVLWMRHDLAARMARGELPSQRTQ
jgi:hypothetical protein